MDIHMLPDARDLELLRTRMSTQFQMPSAYDDALSYQGLIYKLIQYLKDTMQNVEDWNLWLEDFVATFDTRLQDTVRNMVQELYENGKLAELTAQVIDVIQDQIDELSGDLRQRGINVKAPPFNAKGDDSTNDYEALQGAIDYAYDNDLPVIIPDGRYIISKPLVLYGGTSENDNSGTKIIGGSREGTVIVKNNSDTLNTNTSEFDTNAIVIFGNRNLNNTQESRNILVTDLQLEGKDVHTVKHGFHMPLNTVSCVLRNIRVQHVEKAIYTSGHNYQNIYSFVRLERVVDGIYHDGGGLTSNIYEEPYVNVASGIAYKIHGNYMTMISPCADNVTGIVYALAGYQGTVISPGSESSDATSVFNFKDGGGTSNYTACAITGANTWMLNGENASHIVMGLQAKVTFIGGWINRYAEQSSKAATGYLYNSDNAHPTTSIHMYGTRSNPYTKEPDNIPNDLILQMADANMNRGGTNTRPEKFLYVGKRFFDTGLGYPIYWNGSWWVNAVGDVV